MHWNSVDDGLQILATALCKIMFTTVFFFFFFFQIMQR